MESEDECFPPDAGHNTSPSCSSASHFDKTGLRAPRSVLALLGLLPAVVVRAANPISWARLTVKLLSLPRDAAAVAGWPARWLLRRTSPVDGSRPAPHQQAGSASGAAAWDAAGKAEAGRAERRCPTFPVLAMLLLLLIPLLLLPLTWRRTPSSEDWRPLRELGSVGRQLAPALGSLYVSAVSAAQVHTFPRPECRTTVLAALRTVLLEPPSEPPEPPPPSEDQLEAVRRVTVTVDRLRREGEAAEGVGSSRACCNRTASDCDGQLAGRLRGLHRRLDQRLQLHAAGLRHNLSCGAAALAGGVSRQQAVSIAQQQLALYDADKTGQFDFALESAGGSIVSTKCTEAYGARAAQLTVLGVPVWYPQNNPRSVIQAGGRPGECFAFHGEGLLEIGLSRLVRPTEFVLEHVARELTPDGSVRSAPRRFAVLGVTGFAGEAVPLGEFQYEERGPPLQPDVTSE
ncbi:nuclear migration and anchoring protein unc-84-like [Pollicipes pollicipes]|uniref:nuclear migration and anchoring protein unc-84-like n=1 Tax=Pollicipes pollicipes TaxID=41117 RepID=UPI0018856074|nr:nuclear migration and anchoring protein unc-84-like [Pollicipes pollicipes]